MTTPTPVAKKKGKSLESFRASHDRKFIVPGKIRAGLAELGDSWEYEAEFVRRCQVSLAEFAVYRGEFADYAVDTPRINGMSHGKRAWAGTKAFAAKLRELL